MNLTDPFDSGDHNELSQDDLLQGIEHHDLTSSFSDDAGLGLDLNYQDCVTHHYHTDDGSSLDHSSLADSGMNWESDSYTSMADGSDAGLEGSSGDGFDPDGTYTQDAISSFSWEGNAATEFSHNAVMPRSTTPDYENAAYHADWQKFNEDMAVSLANEGRFSRAADYQKEADYHHDKVNESLGG